jgi:sugar/nucleoside kinase (ribokinase family)
MRNAGNCDVIVTNGSRSVWAILKDGDEITVRPPSIPVVDTTGAGDVFKARLLYGLLQGLSVRQSLIWAVAAAAAKVGRAGTTADPADLSTVEQLTLTNCEQVE